jgi:hypothetical protein
MGTSTVEGGRIVVARIRTTTERRGAMTTALDPNARRRLRELDERTARAWGAYHESLRDLEGQEYHEAESRCWDRLQRKLREVERQRAELTEHAARH